MGMIKRADFEQQARNAYVMDLSSLERRGQAVIDTANDEARRILRDARAERERLIATAEQEGRDKGYADGLATGRQEGISQGVEEARAQHAEQLAQLTQMWIDQLDDFEARRDDMLSQARTQVIELAAAIARRVCRRTVKLDPGVVLNQLEAVLSSVTESTRLVISVHPDEAETVRGELPSMVERFAKCEHAQIITDPALSSGSCIARVSGGGIIDASLPTQINRILDILLPGSESVGLEDRIGLDEEDDGMAKEHAA